MGNEENQSGDETFVESFFSDEEDNKDSKITKDKLSS